MSKHMTHSNATQMSAMQQEHKALHSGTVATPTLMHRDIAKRAYEIYVGKNHRQGQSEENWLQAEQELRNQESWLQAGQK